MAVAVLISLLVARLITPLLAAYFVVPHKQVEEKDGLIMRSYTRVVGWSVRQKYITFLLGILFFAGSIYSTSLLPSGFLPKRTSRAPCSWSNCLRARASTIRSS